MRRANVTAWSLPSFKTLTPLYTCSPWCSSSIGLTLNFVWGVVQGHLKWCRHSGFRIVQNTDTVHVYQRSPKNSHSLADLVTVDSSFVLNITNCEALPRTCQPPDTVDDRQSLCWLNTTSTRLSVWKWWSWNHWQRDDVVAPLTQISTFVSAPSGHYRGWETCSGRLRQSSWSGSTGRCRAVLLALSVEHRRFCRRRRFHTASLLPTAALAVAGADSSHHHRSGANRFGSSSFPTWLPR